MVIEFVSSSNARQIGSSPISVPRPSGVASGDMLICMIFSAGQSPIVPPSGWMTRFEGEWGTPDGSGNRPKFISSWRLIESIATEPANYAFGKAGNTSAVMMAFRGVDNASPFATTNDGYVAGNVSVISTSIVTTEDEAMLIVGAGRSSGALALSSGPDGMTHADTSTGGNPVQYGWYGIQALEGASGTKSASFSGSTQSNGYMTAVRPASIGPTARPWSHAQVLE